MTIDEALELGKTIYENIINNTNNIIPETEYIEFVQVAIQAFEEIQQYRELGTVEEILKVFNNQQTVVAKQHETLKQYRAIGTIEEFKALKEKNEPKKPLLRLCGDCQRDCIDCDRYEDRCPTCNGGLYVESGKPHEHCPHCGQKLDWK